MPDSLTRIRHDLRQLGRAFEEQRVRYAVGSFLLAAIFVVVIRVVYPEVFPVIVSDLFISVVGAMFGVYLSVELLLPYVRHVERIRIDESADIVESHDEPTTFMRFDDMPGRAEALPDVIPVTVEHLPREIHGYDQFAYPQSISGQYRIPDELSALIEPDSEDLRELFRREDRSNGRKVRLDGVNDERFDVSVTTYYRSFLTNFCPDYPMSGGATIRELSEPLLFDGDRVRPLSETPFSDHFGGGGLVITADGRTVLPVRSGSVAVEGKALHVSFSGSFDVSHVEEGGVDLAQREIATGELSLSNDDIRSVTYLGTTRRIERLGKPDTVAIALADAESDLSTSTDQFVGSYEIELLPDRDIESVEELFEPAVARTIVERIVDEIERHPYRPSLGLTSFLYLYWQLAVDE